MKKEKWIIEYRFIINNTTVFDIGNEEAETIKINSEGNLVMFGSSLAGSIKKSLRDTYGDIMGSDGEDKQKSIESKIIISDLIGENKGLFKRPGIKINTDTGTAENKAKLETTLVTPGKDFSFYIRGEYLEQEDKNRFKNYIQEVRNNIKNKTIQFGGNKTKGFGEFKIKEISKLVFVFPKDEDKFLNYLLLEEIGKRDFDGWENDVKISHLEEDEYEVINFIGEISDGILIKGKPKKENGIQIVEFYNEKQDENRSKSSKETNYLIPSSTIKGNMRSFFIKVKNTFENSDENSEITNELLDKVFGNKNRQGEAVFYDSEISVKDNENKKFKYNRIKIDRFTGGVMNESLLTEERIGNTKITIKVRIKKEILKTDKNIKKLFLLYFRDLGMGKTTMGSNTSVGAGRFKNGTLKLGEWKLSFSSEGTIKAENIVKEEITKLFG